MKQTLFYLTCLIFLALTACTEPITVGNDLLEDDRATLGQTSDIVFTTRVVKDDSLLTFNATSNLAIAGFSFGGLQDDIFGNWKHGVYLTPTLPRSNTSGLPIRPSFAYSETRGVDSVVLIVPIDTANAFYGPGRTFNLRMGQIPTVVDQNMSYYASVELTRSLIDINRLDAFSATKPATLLYDTLYSSTGDSVLASHIRVSFNDNFLASLNAQDETTFQGDSSLLSFFAGVYLEPEGDLNGLVGLQPQRSGVTPISGFYIFYRDTSAAMTPLFYRMPLSLWLPKYQKDFSNSLVGDLLTDGDDAEQVALAGQEGIMTEITFPDLTSLENKVINRAEIQFFQQLVDGYDNDGFPAPELVGLYYKNNEGRLVTIADRELLRNATLLEDYVGGNARRDENNNLFYRNFFSVHLQRMIEGEVSNKIYLRVVPTDRDPSRVLLRGPGAAELPAKVTVTFTEIGN